MAANIRKRSGAATTNCQLAENQVEDTHRTWQLEDVARALATWERPRCDEATEAFL